MKSLKYLFILTSICSMTFLTSCDDEPSASDISRVTFFPTFEYEGGNLAIVGCNTSYNLPPVTATENGVELPTTTTIEGTYSGATEFDIAVADKYIISTSAVNADGFPAFLTRTVWVVCTGDLVNSIEGLYTSTVLRDGTPGAPYTNMKYVMIRKVGDNEYEISDAIGGYYDIGRGYGDAYRAGGMVITANNIPANDFSFSGPIPVGAFGGSLEMTSFTVDPATKTIHFTSDWSIGPYAFDVTLTQVQI